MRYLNITGLDKPVSVIGLGTNTRAFTLDRYDGAVQLIDTFLNAGGNLIDTAHIYGFGNSEKTLGRWLKKAERRDKIVLVTKGCHPVVDPNNIFGQSWQPRVTPDAIRADLTESLERLHTDYIDLYLLHRDDETMPVGPIIRTLNAEQDRGRIRAFGASNWCAERIAAANAYAAQRGLKGFVISSVGLSLARPLKMFFPGTLFADDATREWHRAQQFPVMAWATLAAGFMSGRFQPDQRGDESNAQVYFSKDNFERLRRAKELAARKNVTPLQIGLAYVLRQPFPAIALVGPTSVAHLNETLGALNIELNDNDSAFLESAERSQ